MKLSPHFSLDELTRSDTAVRLGLSNTPTQDIINALQHLAYGLERVREALGGVPLYISSGYRSPEVNRAIGGSRTSQHMAGEAADFIAPEFGTPTQVAHHLASLADDLQFDQLILEGGRWVHISFAQGRARRSVLTATFTKGVAAYTEGLV